MVNSHQTQNNRQHQTVIDLFDPHQAMRRSHPQATSVAPSPLPSSMRNASVATNHFHPPQPWAQPQGSATHHSAEAGISTFTPQTAERPTIPKQEEIHADGVSSIADILGVTRQKRAPFPPTQRRKPPKKTKSSTQAARRSGRSPNVNVLFAGGSLLAGLVLVGDVGSLLESKPVSNVCQEVVQTEATLSRERLTQLISIPERQPKSAVRDVLDAPYCVLPDIEIRKGAIAQREAYPLAFDPQTWVVLLYEGDEYAGYSFSFQQ
jgi:hypothetical protein